MSSNEEDDVTWHVHCHPLAALELPFPIKTVYLASDLVSYQETPCVGNVPRRTTAVFKHRFMENGMFRTRPSRLWWFRQLLSAVDDLNYRYGIMHQDIAARNIVINEDVLQIFDFNYSIMIAKHYTPDGDDIKGVIFTLYELITLDEHFHFRELPHKEQDAEAPLQMEWPKHPEVKLDSDVKGFRTVLDSWFANRKGKAVKPTDTWVQ
ncbi:Protein kinase-like domain protein [Metarhizium rileyi]|uniref:EKC/KEOPS complex subunit BUD32 n=1 Tax=Metarhizium rileyi (strain RCEF 4871) TaxID=1649241 RepID=A0A167BSJ1_METRR|nr:Protein kinase-like domain protein [Metarhizium rileyi RCEF 4871]TWU73733.1 hypothetical protein ED733_000696 [Metarhizium rileyi]